MSDKTPQRLVFRLFEDEEDPFAEGESIEFEDLRKGDLFRLLDEGDDGCEDGTSIYKSGTDAYFDNVWSVQADRVAHLLVASPRVGKEDEAYIRVPISELRAHLWKTEP